MTLRLTEPTNCWTMTITTPNLTFLGMKMSVYSAFYDRLKKIALENSVKIIVMCVRRRFVDPQDLERFQSLV